MRKRHYPLVFLVIGLFLVLLLGVGVFSVISVTQEPLVPTQIDCIINSAEEDVICNGGEDFNDPLPLAQTYTRITGPTLSDNLNATTPALSVTAVEATFTAMATFAEELLAAQLKIASGVFSPYTLAFLTFSPDCLLVARVYRGTPVLDLIALANAGLAGDINLDPSTTVIVTQALVLFNNNSVKCTTGEPNPPCFVCPSRTVFEDAVIEFKGVSLSGAEERDNFRSAASQGNYIPHDDNAALYFYKGMNTFRVPIAWEYFADADGNLLPETHYHRRLENLIDGLLAKDATVIITLNNYMRYNPGDLERNVFNTDPEGDDVIDVCRRGTRAPTIMPTGAPLSSDPPGDFIQPTRAPTQPRPCQVNAAYPNIWRTIVNLYRKEKVVYGLMNQPHDIDSAITLAPSLNAAIRSIRNTEIELSLKPHLILIPGNARSTIRQWGASRLSDNMIFFRAIVDPGNNFAVDVNQYFDQGQQGRYPNNEDCQPAASFASSFAYQFAPLIRWATTNKYRLFVTEFGAPDTPNCRETVDYFLRALNSFAYSNTTGAGVIGWTVWASINEPFRQFNRLSLAAGNKANGLMWNNTLYEKYLVPLNAPIPSLEGEPIVLDILNNGTRTLFFKDGYLPFQFRGSADLLPGQHGFLYSNDDDRTPTKGLSISYTTGEAPNSILVFGIREPDRVSSVSSQPQQRMTYASSEGISGLVAFKATQCGIPARGANDQRCFIVNDR